MTGDYILSIASIMISRLKNDDVTLVLSQVSFLVDIDFHPTLTCACKEYMAMRFIGRKCALGFE